MPTAEQGVIVARIVNASGLPLPFNHMTIAPKNLNVSAEEKPYELTAIGSSAADSTLFAASLPKGHYSLSSIHAYYSNGERYYSRWINADVSFGTFNIEPGQVTDLGTIIYYPKVQGDRMIDLLTRSQQSDNAALINIYVPSFDMSESTALTWNENDIAEQQQSLYVSVVQNPVVYNERYLAADGSIYFVGKLGVILKRSPSGAWEMDAVDTDSDLNAIATNGEGTLAVGGDHGSLYIRQDDSEWRTALIDDDYQVEELSFYNEHFLDVILRKFGHVRIVRGDLRQPELNWQVLATYTPTGGWHGSDGVPYGVGVRQAKSSRRSVMNVSTEIIDDKRYLFISWKTGPGSSPFGVFSNPIFTYDQSTWLMAESDGIEGDIDGVVDAGVTKLGIKRPGFFSWTMENQFYRYDHSSGTWRSVATQIDQCVGEENSGKYGCGTNDGIRNIRNFTFIGVPMFISDLEAIAIIRYTPYKRAEEVKAIVESKDGGATWMLTSRKLPQEYCTHTIPEATDVLLVGCYGISSDFYQSSDWGETWELVKEHENF